MYVNRYVYSTCNLCKSTYHKPTVQQTVLIFCLANGCLLLLSLLLLLLLLLLYNQSHFQTTSANTSLLKIYCVPKYNLKINMYWLTSFAWNHLPSIAAWLLTQRQPSPLPYVSNMLRLIQYSFIQNKQYLMYFLHSTWSQDVQGKWWPWLLNGLGAPLPYLISVRIQTVMGSSWKYQNFEACKSQHDEVQSKAFSLPN